MRYVRLRFNVSTGVYQFGDTYDVEATEEMRHLVEAGFAVIVPYPPRGTVTTDTTRDEVT